MLSTLYIVQRRWHWYADWICACQCECILCVCVCVCVCVWDRETEREREREREGKGGWWWWIRLGRGGERITSEHEGVKCRRRGRRRKRDTEVGSDNMDRDEREGKTERKGPKREAEAGRREMEREESSGPRCEQANWGAPPFPCCRGQWGREREGERRAEKRDG